MVKTAEPGTGTVVIEAPVKPAQRKAPMNHVIHLILHNDDLHTYEYVIAMLMQLFFKSAEQAFQHAREVDRVGVTLVETTTHEREDLKRDQIKAFGKDPLIEDSPGSMFASIEPAD